MNYTHLGSDKRVARKTHTCIWCGQSIVKGEQYISEAGIYDGGFQNSKFHQECKTACSEDLKTNHEDEFTPWENERPAVRAYMNPSFKTENITA